MKQNDHVTMFTATMMLKKKTNGQMKQPDEFIVDVTANVIAAILKRGSGGALLK